MTLADLIHARQEAITERWLEEVRPLAPRPDLTREQLVNSLPLFFEELERALRHLEDPAVTSALPAASPIAEVHGSQRHALGYTTSAVAREYPLLQELILRTAQEAGVAVGARESILLARCMGTAAAEALAHFSTAHDRALLEGVASAHARQASAEHALTQVQEAEARARDSEARLRLVLDAMPHLINFVDAQQRYVLANHAYRAWFGVEPESVLGRTVREVVGEENYATVRPVLERALAGEEVHYERPFLFQGGRWGYAHGHYVPYRAPDGKVQGFVALVQDITERHQLTADLERVRAELEVERARLHDLFEHAPAIICTLRGPEHVFELANPLYQRGVAGGRPLVGLRVRDALPEVVEQGFVTLLDEVYREGKPYVGREVPLRVDRHGDGRLEDTWWTFVYQPTRDERGAVDGIAVFGFEVSEHVRSTAALRRSDARFRALFDAMDEGFCVLQLLFDEAGRPADYLYLEANPAFERQTGIHAPVGRTIRQLVPGIEQVWVDTYGRVALSGEPTRFEEHSPTLGRWFDVYAFRIGEPEERRVALLFTDVTARKHVEQQLRQRADLERQLIGIVSHDLRNPLQVIQLSAATLLRRSGMDERQAAVIGRISATAERMTRMIRDLLDFTRTRLGGGLVLTRGAVDLHALARQVVDEVLLAHPGRLVDVEHEGDARGAWDGDRLAQLLGNLLQNALAYGPPHSPVRVSTRGLDGEVLLEVHNAGEPIAPEQLQRLFRPFERGEHQVTSAGRSIGLGLFIVDAIVRGHGGRIEVQSAAGAGTTFTVRLPRGQR